MAVVAEATTVAEILVVVRTDVNMFVISSFVF